MGIKWYDDQIRKVGCQLINNFQKNNSILSGVNGPYNDEETVVRNLSHLIIITSIEVLCFENKKLKHCLQDMGDYLINQRQQNDIYILRNNPLKDKSNGVIGHAWVMEAYIYLYKVFKDTKYLQIATELYEKHKFNNIVGLWHRPKEDSFNSIIDNTLNHQLWFAAIAGELYYETKSDIIKEHLNVFFKNLNKNISIDRYGLIHHNVIKRNSVKEVAKGYIKLLLNYIKRIACKPSYMYKENGYHIFNMVAFARLYSTFPEISFWNESKFNRLLEYVNSERMLKEMLNPKSDLDASLKNSINDKESKSINIYGYPYNVPGFEVYYLKQIFKDKIDDKIMLEYLGKQFELIYDEEEGMFTKCCFDKVTINYRVYEYYKAMEKRDIY